YEGSDIRQPFEPQRNKTEIVAPGGSRDVKVLASGARPEGRRCVDGVCDRSDQGDRRECEISQRYRRTCDCRGFPGDDEDSRSDENAYDRRVAFESGQIAFEINLCTLVLPGSGRQGKSPF